MTAVSNTTVKLSFTEDEQLVIREMSESDVQEFNLISQGIAKSLVVLFNFFFYMNMYG